MSTKTYTITTIPSTDAPRTGYVEAALFIDGKSVEHLQAWYMDAAHSHVSHDQASAWQAVTATAEQRGFHRAEA